MSASDTTTDGNFFKMRTKTVDKLTRREQLVEELKQKILTEHPENNIETLSDKQLNAISFLIECPSMQEAAEKSGVSVRTLRRWMQIPLFAHEFNKTRRQDIDQAMAHLLSSAREAAVVLKQLLQSQDPTVQLRAAKIILQTSQKSLETVERIEELTEQELEEAETVRKVKDLTLRLEKENSSVLELERLKSDLQCGRFTRPDWISIDVWNRTFQQKLPHQDSHPALPDSLLLRTLRT